MNGTTVHAPVPPSVPVAPARRPLVRVLVCGSPDREDDGLAAAAIDGLELTRRLAGWPASTGAAGARIDLRRCDGLRVEDLLDLPAGGTRFLIVDAVSGVEPGTLVRCSLADLARTGGAGAATPRSSHELAIGLVLGLAEVLLGHPVEGTFLGLGGASFGYGVGLSEPVAAALPALRDAIDAELTELGGPH